MSAVSQLSSVPSRQESVMFVPKLFLQAGDRDNAAEFDLETFLNTIRFQRLTEMDESSLEQHLSNVDAVDLLNAVKEATRELTRVKLENHFMSEFLQKSDPKLLVGLKRRRATASSGQRSMASTYMVHPATGFTTGRVSSRPSVVTTQSVFTTGSLMSTQQKKVAVDYRLNYRAKADLAEKAMADVDRNIAEMENKALKRIKTLNTRIEEMRFTCKELQETAKNFEHNFLNDERDLAFLKTASEREVERKLRQFVDNWLKNARTLLAAMRLRMAALWEICLQQRTDLMNKTDIKLFLSAIDFDQLVIEREAMLVSLEEKQNHLKGLKDVTGKASLAMSKEKKTLVALECESKQISHQTLEALEAVKKLEREVKYVKGENNKDLLTLEHLQDKVERFEAPSVNEYMESKNELLALEKEEKLLQRKIHLSTMKLNHILKRCNRRDAAASSLSDSQ